MSSTPPPPPDSSASTPPPPGSHPPPTTNQGQPPPPGATPPPETEAPAQWDSQPSSGGGSGNKRALLIIGIGVLVLIVGVVAVISLGGDDDDGSASGEGIEQSVPDLRRQTPGSFDAGAPIPVTLEEGDVSFLLTAVADDPTSFVAITEVKDPDGEVIYSLSEDGAVSGELSTKILEGSYPGEVSLLAPVHPELDVRPGTYEVTTNAPSDVTVLIKSGEVDAEVPQFIDLNLWRVSQEVDAATLEQEVRAAVDRVLQNQNLSVGSVNVVDADQEDVQQFADIQEDQAPDVCAAMTEAVGENRSLDLAILETATTADGETLLGFSVGLPGSSPAPGVRQTCTLAVTSDTPIDLLASTLVHEGSHFMGLYHTAERDGLSFDNFADTAECPAEADADGDGVVGELECGEEGGANNYMFWIAEGNFPQTDLSPDQAWALRRHPLVYAAPTEE